jgi:hypothetical protein
MPYGLCNTPGAFQAIINKVLQEVLDEGGIVDIDDILIYSDGEETHIDLVKKVLELLKQNNLTCTVGLLCMAYLLCKCATTCSKHPQRPQHNNHPAQYDRIL